MPRFAPTWTMCPVLCARLIESWRYQRETYNCTLGRSYFKSAHAANVCMYVCILRNIRHPKTCSDSLIRKRRVASDIWFSLANYALNRQRALIESSGICSLRLVLSNRDCWFRSYISAHDRWIIIFDSWRVVTGRHTQYRVRNETQRRTSRSFVRGSSTSFDTIAACSRI